MSTAITSMNEIGSRLSNLPPDAQKSLWDYLFFLEQKYLLRDKLNKEPLKLFDPTDLLDGSFPQWSEEDIAPILEVREGFNKREVQTW